MARLTALDTFGATLSGSATLPIDLEILAGTSQTPLTQDTRFVRVEATVEWSFATPWNSGQGHGILNTVAKANQYFPTPYFAILNEGRITNTNTTVAAGSDTSTEAHNVVFLWRGGSITNAATGLLEQRSADDGVGAVHFEKGQTGPNELYNDGTITSSLLGVMNWGQFTIENTGTINGNIYSTNNVYSEDKHSYFTNSGSIFGTKIGTSTSDVLKQTTVYVDDRYVHVENSGHISGTGHFGIRSSGFSTVELNNSGTIGAGTYGVYLLGGGEIVNSGTIESKMAIVFGLTNDPTHKSISIANSSIVRGTTSDAIYGGVLDTVDIINLAGGQIVSDGVAGNGISLRGVSGRTQDAAIENWGLIEGATGIKVLKTAGSTEQKLLIENHDTISARTSSGTAVSSEADTTVTLNMQSGSQMIGGVKTLGSTDFLTFFGDSTIDGATVSGMETVLVDFDVRASITGTLTAFDDLTLDEGSQLSIGGAVSGGTLTLLDARLELGGTAASTVTNFVADVDSELHFNTLSATGTISVANATIDGVKLTVGSATDATVTVMTIAGSTPIAGTFEGLAEGASLSVGTSTYSISYVGGDGNDIVLTRTATGGGTPTPSPVVPIVIDVLPDSGKPIVAGPEAENFKGTAATDLVVFTGNRADYVITRNGDGTFTIKGPHAPDTLNSIERLQFDDGVLALDVEDNPGLAFRLYHAAFDRAPDLKGLGYWIAQLDSGAIDPLWMAHAFILSNEFSSLYGDYRQIPADDFLTLLYKNILGRTPEDQGFAFWRQAVADGASYEWLLAAFSESNENQSNIAPIVSEGIWYQL